MCSVEQMSRPMVRPCSLPMTMSSRQHRTSCSRLLKTSGPMNPATSLTWSQAPLGCTFASSGSDGPAEAILPGFEDHHVDAVRGAVGELGSLPGLEVEPVSLAGLGLCVFQDLLDGDVEGLVAVVGARRGSGTSWRPCQGSSQRRPPGRRYGRARTTGQCPEVRRYRRYP